jgi:hypothetical protein
MAALELRPHARVFIPATGKKPKSVVGTLKDLGASPEGTRRLWDGPVTLIGGPAHLSGAVGRISGFAGESAWFLPDTSSRPGMGEVFIPLGVLASVPTDG